MVLPKFQGAMNALSRVIGGATYKQAILYTYMIQTGTNNFSLLYYIILLVNLVIRPSLLQGPYFEKLGRRPQSKYQGSSPSCDI